MSAKAYKNLKISLGQQDAFISLQEIALRELNRLSSTSPKPEEFWNSLTQSYGIKVNNVSPLESLLELGRIRVLLAIGALERYFHELKKETYNLSGISIFDKENTLDDLLQLFEPKLINLKNNAFLHGIIRYYCAVRNEAAHPYDIYQHAGNVKAIALSIQNLDGRDYYFKEYGNIRLPDKSKELTFKDYIICTRACKDYAFAIWITTLPPLKTIASKLDWKTRFSHLIMNRERYMTACGNDLRTHFGLDRTETDRFINELEF